MAYLWQLAAASDEVLDGLMQLASSGDEDGPWVEDPRCLELTHRTDEILMLGEEWHTLLFLLTGSRWGAPAPLGQVLMGPPALGPVVLDDEVFPGWPVYEDQELAELEVIPAARLTSKQVREVAEALASIDPHALVVGLDPAALAARGVFPWDEFLETKKRRPKAQRKSPGMWFDVIDSVRVPEPELPTFLAARIAALTDFFQRSAEASRGMFQCPFGAGG